MAACSEISFSPTRTARPSSERSNRYRWSCSSNSADERTAVVLIEKTLSSGELGDDGRQLVERERLRDHLVRRCVLHRRPADGAGEHCDLRVRMLSADLVDERGAVLRTDMNVEKHDVDGAVGQPLTRLRQARSLANDPAFELEVQPAE